MWKLLQRWLPKRSAERPPLRGAPAPLRRKHYTTEDGHCLTYCYLGYREAQEAGGFTFVFRLEGTGVPAADRAAALPPVEVELSPVVLEALHREACRPLRAQERFAVAKCAFFLFLDREPQPLRTFTHTPSAEEAAAIWRQLDL